MSLKVLLADDSMTAQNMGKKILAESGYDVTTVSNGAAAVKKIAEVKPDVVILDIYMPGYTGLEVCERVRANLDTANLPVLLTVGKMEPYRAEDGAKVRADGVIVKPFEATDLLAVVKKMAEKAPATRHVAAVPEPEAVEEEIGQPEPAMPAAVEVPSEMAAAPALAMEEFNTAPAEVPEFKPTIEWTAAPEMPVEQVAVQAEPPSPEIPWAFEQTADHFPLPVEPQVESNFAPEAKPTSDVEFTSAPKAGYVDVQQVDGLEAGLEASPTGELEITTDPGLTSPQEMTEFVTSFGVSNPSAEATEEVIAELPTIEAPSETPWDGWAQAEQVAEAAVEAAPEPAVEPTLETSSELPTEQDSHVAEVAPPKPMIDDFEAKVAAAMAGFGVEPEVKHEVEPVAEHHDSAAAEALASPNVEDFEARVAAAMSGFATEPIDRPHEPVEEAHSQPEIEAVADDFEARVAAAMSGFATEPVGADSVAESHAEPMAEAHVEPPVADTHPVPAATPATSQDEFDARLAQALSAFDTTPEQPSHDETSTLHAIEAPVEPSSVSLNETTVLPHEAMLSLEEEMKQALAQPSSEAPVLAAAAPAPELPAQPGQEPQSHPAESEVVDHPIHVSREPGPPELPEVAAAAFAAAATTSVPPTETAAPASEKFADAVQRAIERLKPQLIAEIVKELQGE